MALIKKPRKIFRTSFNQMSFGYNIFMKSWGLYKEKEILKLLGLNGNEIVGDIGGGTGHYSHFFVPYCREVHLLDNSPKMMDRLKNNSGIKTCIADACSTPYDDHFFDLLFLNDVIHHIEDQEKLMCELKRILKPGGKLVIYDFDAGHWITRVLGMFEDLLFGGLKYLLPGEAEALARRAGFKKKILVKKGFYYILVLSS